jgi:FdhE protein
MKRSKWDQRIERAEELSATHPFAAEVLLFYKQIAIFQKDLYCYIERAKSRRPKESVFDSFREDLDFDLLLPRFPEFLLLAEKIGPPQIALHATDLKTQPTHQWRELLSSSWTSGPDFPPALENTEALLAWLLLQPPAAYIADHGEPVPRNQNLAVCPCCSRRPVVGVLRPEGDGGKRSLICSMCSTEWPFGRIVCPACGEETVEKLAVYTANQFDHVRVEACDTCHYYIKTVDLTKNGLAVPVVDELATIPLNLWARDHQYVKLRPNVLGI